MVLDRQSGYLQFKHRHINDTRYPEFRDKSFKYERPHIRIEKNFTSEFIDDLMKTNRTVQMTEDQWSNFSFAEAHHITIKGKKYIMAHDTLGNFSYFVTRTFNRFQYVGSFPSGLNTSEVQSLKQHGGTGFFAVLKNHFSFFLHMNPFSEHQNVCLPGLTVTKGEDENAGISLVE